MLLTQLPKFKRFILSQIFDQSIHDYQSSCVDHIAEIKDWLQYSSILDRLGYLEIVHVKNTKTIMLTEKFCLTLVNNLNKLPIDVVFKTPPRKLFQKSPQHTTHHAIKTMDTFKELMTVVSSFKRSHETSLEGKRKSVEQRRASLIKAAKVRLDLVRTTIETGARCISIDVEAFEFSQNKLLEIGYSILQDGKIETKHLIILDNLKYKNKKFVPNNRDNFLFGTSRRVTLKHAIQILKADLEIEPYHLVGHSLLGDIKWLKDIGITVRNQLVSFDTSFVCLAVYKPNNRTASLAELCTFCDVETSFTHNAGNDAYFTIQALMKLCDKPFVSYIL